MIPQSFTENPNNYSVSLPDPRESRREEEIDAHLAGIQATTETALWTLLKSTESSTSDEKQEAYRIASGNLSWLASELRAARTARDEARERLHLVDRVCYSHHAAHLCAWEGDVCPVCADAGGVAFYAENTRIYRGEPK